MRLTFTDIKNDFLRKTQNPGSTDTTLLAFFTANLGQRYQIALAEIRNYQTQDTKTATTVASQQFYHNPTGIVNIETATIDIGGVDYPLIRIASQREWDYVNQVLVAQTAIPSFIFPRRDDFGVYPIPQDAYTITLNYNLRDRILTQDDYTTGTIALTRNSATVEGTTTVFTASMIGRWLQVTPNGYWYRIAGQTDGDTITLENTFEQTSVTGASYRIGETPELPEETHICLVDGVVSDYFGMRGDLEKSKWWNNKFWTGDGDKEERTGAFSGGILGAKQRYNTRDDSALVQMGGVVQGSPASRIWGSSITE